MSEPIKSKGHLTFANGFEWIEEGGEVFRAPLHAAIDIRTGNRIGRWEASVSLVRQYPTVYPFLKEALS